MPRSQKQRTDGMTGDYPPDWADISTAVKEAAGWCCVRCGHPHDPGKSMKPCPDCPPERGFEVNGTERKSVVQAAADAACQTCQGSREVIDDDNSWYCLTVHHLDMDKSNCVDWNMAALCQRCHLSVQGRVDFYQQYLFEITGWMRPYVEKFWEAHPDEFNCAPWNNHGVKA